MAIIWGAAANTVPAAMWTIYWLARDSVARERVACEVLSQLEVEPDVETAVPGPHTS